nr:hypothetical protein [Tanacetum cinerariifolium]
MFEISGNNCNDWFRQLKLVLRVERKLFDIEQPISLASPTDSEYLCSEMQYMIHNDVACLMLGTKGKGKANGKRKDKQVYIPKPKNPKPSAKEHPAKDDTCHYCKEVGHCKRNCHAYLAGLIKKRSKLALPRCCFSSPFGRKWICLVFYELWNFSFKNDVLYFNAIARNVIYEIDMHNLVPNVNSIYNVSTKRAKHNLDSTYLWHCRLAHISKMTRKSFPHLPERATDLLGIIHADVCGPLRHVSRQGASYFITFTNDYNRYGYVYLLKHKHE